MTERKVTKTDFAAYLEVSRSTLDAYLSDKWPIPSDKIEMISAFFGVSPGYLFSGPETDKTIHETLKSQQEQIDKLTELVKKLANSMQIEI